MQEVEPAKHAADNLISARDKVPRPTAAGKPSPGSQSAADKAARAKKKKKASTQAARSKGESPESSQRQNRTAGSKDEK